MAAPVDPFDRLPPFLRRYCPDRETINRQSQLWAGKVIFLLYRALTALAKACVWGCSALGRSGWQLIAYTARRWKQLDRKWRIWAGCTLLTFLLLPLLSTVSGRRREPAATPVDKTPASQPATETPPKPETASTRKAGQPRSEQQPAKPETASEPKADEPHNEQPAIEPDSSAQGFRLVAITDLFYMPTDVQGRSYRGVDSAKIPETSRLFSILKDGRKSEHGFFNVHGKAVTSRWISSNPSVLKIIPKPEGCPDPEDTANPFCAIVGFGKTTVTATVGDWSDHKDFAVVEVPIKIPSDTSVHDWIKQFGFPVRKFWTGQARSGFDPIPAGCCGCGFVDGGVWVDDGTRERGGRTEYWEYAAWPRCLFGISDDLIRQVATRPAIPSTAAAPDGGGERRSELARKAAVKIAIAKADEYQARAERIPSASRGETWEASQKRLHEVSELVGISHKFCRMAARLMGLTRAEELRMIAERIVRHAGITEPVEYQKQVDEIVSTSLMFDRIEAARHSQQTGAIEARDDAAKVVLTKAEEEQFLRLEALCAKLHSLPTSVPPDQRPAAIQQEANLRAQIADLEPQLGFPAEPKEK